MKYIRKAKNTKQAGRMHDDFVTEMVPEEVFSKAHKAMGGWELVTNKECERLCGLAEAHKEEYRVAKEAQTELSRAARAETDALKATEDYAEFEAFKAWKASQE